MKFVDSIRFSPVAQKVDMPWEEDYFHVNPENITPDVISHSIIDENWWYIQEDRCKNGFEIENAIEPGGDAIVDGIDAIWHGNDVYLPEYDYWIYDRKVKVTGRHYFYLNFWKIFGLDHKTGYKTIIPPRFLDMDFLFFLRIDNMIRFKKDDQELKGRQLGFSEKGAGGVIGWNFTFLDGSLNVIVGGVEEDALKTMRDCIRGLNGLINTQFYKERAKGGDSQTYVKAKNTESQIHCLTAKDNPQAVSRFCLAKGTEVVMFDGTLEKVENLIVGEQLMGIDSTPRNIRQITSGVDEMYRISSKGTEDFVCNSEHLLYCYHKPQKRKKYINKYGLYVQNNFNDPDIIPVDSEHFLIKAKDYYKKSKTFKKNTLIEKSRGIEFQEKRVLIDPYFLGVWLGDGDSEAIRITSMDGEIESYLEEFAEKNNLRLKKSKQINPINKELSSAKRFGLSEAPRNKKGGIRIKSNIKESFRHYNLFNNKHIPDEYKYNSREIRLQVLAGLLDTDGWKNKNGYGFAQVNKQIVDDVKYICESLGFSVNISHRENGGINGYISQKIYSLYIYGERVGDIPLKIERKKQPNYEYRSRHPHKYRMSIEKVGLGEYYGFELDGDQLFLLSDFTITHNSPTWVWMEEIGKGKKGWSIETAGYIRPSIEAEGGIKTGWINYIGTGGEMEDGVYDLEERHYDPDKYNVLSFSNRFDEQPNKNKVGHFTSKAWFYKSDKEGNSLLQDSKDFLLEERAKLKPKDRFLHTTQYPIYANEVFYTSGGGFMGEERIQMLNERAAYINNHKDEHKEKRGFLSWKDPKNKNKGVNFTADEEGPFYIYEHPEANEQGEVPYNLYFSGTDSYDQDVAFHTDSLGSCHVWKNFIRADKTYKKWVARIVQRPTEEEGGAERFYENTALLTAYYNARNLIEFSKWRIIDWYTRNGVAALLKERPESILASFITNSKATNRYGIDPSTKKDWINILRETLTKETIENMDDIDQVRRFAKYRYDPTGKKYNCDVTISSALSLVHQQDEQDYTPVYESDRTKEEEKLSYWKTDSEGNLVHSFHEN